MIELVLPCPLSSPIVAVIPRVVAVLWGRGVKVRRLEILPVTSAFEPAICFQTKSVRKRSLSLFTRSLAPCSWVFCFSLSNAVLFFFLSEGCICHLYARRHCSVPGVLPLLYKLKNAPYLTASVFRLQVTASHLDRLPQTQGTY